jgi:hypothetical protein
MHSGQSEHDQELPKDSPDKFYLVVVPEFGKPECKEFDTKDTLVAELRQLSKKRVSCYVFCGERWHISLPPRKLISANNVVEADLSPPPDVIQIDVDGFLFDDVAVVDDNDEFIS